MSDKRLNEAEHTAMGVWVMGLVGVVVLGVGAWFHQVALTALGAVFTVLALCALAGGISTLTDN